MITAKIILIIMTHVYYGKVIDHIEFQSMAQCRNFEKDLHSERKWLFHNQHVDAQIMNPIPFSLYTACIEVKE